MDIEKDYKKSRTKSIGTGDIMFGQNKERGFTIIELAMVIAVIGILAIVTIPKYGAVKDHYRLESSAEAIVSRLSHAKQLAMDRREDIYVRFTSNSVQVVDSNGDPLGDESQFESGVIFDPSQSVANGLAETIPNHPSSVGVKYDYRGFIRAGGVVGDSRYAAAIELRAASGSTIRIHIGAGTGYITMGS